jgi:hypothetical protein
MRAIFAPYAAIPAMRRAVRRAAHGLMVEGCNSTFDAQFLNWDEAARRFGMRPSTPASLLSLTLGCSRTPRLREF